MKPLLALALPFLLASLSQDTIAQTGSGTATYRVTFDATWSSATHPGAFPGGAHFSPLIGGTHTSTSHIWQMGGIASNGMEVMAESGSPSPLAAEITSAIGSGIAGEVVQGPGASSPDSVSTTFTVTDAFPAISLVTMIAPSPDWFLGVDGLNLLESDDWVDTKVVTLLAYDAGTDSGTQFTSSNQNTNPQAPISVITGAPFSGMVPLGTFTFERLSSTLEYGTCNNPQGSLAATGQPILGQSVTMSIHDPVGTMSTPSATFLGISLGSAPGLPCGLAIPGWGLSAPGASGDFLLGGLHQVLAGPTWNGSPASVNVPIPPAPALLGLEIFTQGLLLDPSPRLGVTSGVRMTIGS